MKNGTYDLLKDSALIGLPALGTLYFAIAQIWGLPYAEQIVGTITAVVVFLGVILKVASKKYEKTTPNVEGAVIITNPEGNPEKELYSLELEGDVEALKDKNAIILTIKNQTVSQ